MIFETEHTLARWCINVLPTIKKRLMGPSPKTIDVRNIGGLLLWHISRAQKMLQTTKPLTHRIFLDPVEDGKFRVPRNRGKIFWRTGVLGSNAYIYLSRLYEPITKYHTYSHIVKFCVPYDLRWTVSAGKEGGHPGEGFPENTGRSGRNQYTSASCKRKGKGAGDWPCEAQEGRRPFEDGVAKRKPTQC